FAPTEKAVFLFMTFHFLKTKNSIAFKGFYLHKCPLTHKVYNIVATKIAGYKNLFNHLRTL
ncbi:MAG: hypothetical protein QM541_12280, partial [Flavobacterium sp.]|nr:hypothetical protein [Flavobacterium sp.]